MCDKLKSNAVTSSLLKLKNFVTIIKQIYNRFKKALNNVKNYENSLKWNSCRRQDTTQPQENTEATPTKMVINVTKLNVRVNKYHYNENNIYTTT